MFAKITMALTAVLILGATSAATALPKHLGHHQQTTAARQVPTTAYQSFGAARSTGRVRVPLYIQIQDQNFKNQLGG
jgi:hypothetical protein